MATKHDPRICTVSGCGKPFNAKGFCKNHYLRWRRHGDPLAGYIDRGETLKFLISACEISTNNCIYWPYAKSSAGYGQLTVDGVRLFAHRMVCERVHGKPLSPSYHAAHSCGKGHLGCINPRHLSWKTRAENEADKIAHGTSNHGERCGSAKLTWAEVAELRHIGRSMSAADLAKKFGISKYTVFSILAGRTWKKEYAFQARFGEKNVISIRSA